MDSFEIDTLSFDYPVERDVVILWTSTANPPAKMSKGTQSAKFADLVCYIAQDLQSQIVKIIPSKITNTDIYFKS